MLRWNGPISEAKNGHVTYLNGQIKRSIKSMPDFLFIGSGPVPGCNALSDKNFFCMMATIRGANIITPDNQIITQGRPCPNFQS